MRYKWKRDYSLGKGRLDAEWISPDKVMRIVAIPDSTSPPELDHYKIRVEYVLEYPDADLGYRKIVNRQLDSFFSLYLLQFGERALDMNVIWPDELQNQEDLTKAGIPIPKFPTDPITVRLAPNFETSKLNDTYNLLKKIETKSNVLDLKNILYWFKEGSKASDSVYSFMFRWIALEGLSSIKYYEDYSTDVDNVATSLQHLFSALYDAHEAQIFMTRPNFPTNLAYIYKYSKGMYTNSSGTRDWVQELDDAMNASQYENALQYLWRSVYGLRKEIFHSGQRFRNNPSFLNTYDFFLRELLRVTLLKYIV